MKKIIFTNVLGLDFFPPKPAVKEVPDWYRNTPEYVGEQGKKVVNNGNTPHTIKKCIPVFDAITAGYSRFTVKNLDQSAITFDVNDSVVIKVKNSTGTYVPIFGGDISDIDVKVRTGEPAITQDITITALGALSKLPKTLTEGVLDKDFDGDQIYSILAEILFNQWNEVPAALEWANYEATTTWANAENSGLGEIDRPGDYELTARSASTTDVYSLVSTLARSGLGYIYEDASGRIGYADSTHRGQYLAL